MPSNQRGGRELLGQLEEEGWTWKEEQQPLEFVFQSGPATYVLCAAGPLALLSHCAFRCEMETVIPAL